VANLKALNIRKGSSKNVYYGSRGVLISLLFKSYKPYWVKSSILSSLIL